MIAYPISTAIHMLLQKSMKQKSKIVVCALVEVKNNVWAIK